VDTLELLLMFILAVSFVIPAIGQSYGLDPKLLWLPVIAYSCWVISMAIINPRLKFRYSKERSTVERMRGLSYVVVLPIMIILNGICSYLAFVNSSYFFYVNSTVIAVIPIFSLFAVKSVLRGVFSTERSCLTESQKETLSKMFAKTIGASIFGSFGILTINFQIIIPKDLIAPELSITALLMFVCFYINKQSSQLAATVSKSMVDSKWLNRFNSTVKESHRKRRQVSPPRKRARI
jgi:hypothetical protein